MYYVALERSRYVRGTENVPELRERTARLELGLGAGGKHLLYKYLATSAVIVGRVSS